MDSAESALQLAFATWAYNTPALPGSGKSKFLKPQSPSPDSFERSRNLRCCGELRFRMFISSGY